MKSVSRRYATPALEKGLDILELFARERSGMSKSEVARRLNRTVQEVFRMLRCLEERGYISIGEDEQFRLTLRLFKLVNEYPPVQRLASEALPIMQSLAHELNQSCHLGVLDGGEVIIVAQVDSPKSQAFRQTRVCRRPYACCNRLRHPGTPASRNLQPGNHRVEKESSTTAAKRPIEASFENQEYWL